MRCWICDSTHMRLQWRSNLERKPTPADFAITHTAYGRTGTLYLCLKCGFVQCTDLGEVLPYYEELVDTAYLHSAASRQRQAALLIERLRPYVTPGGRLLDVGAGSGLLLRAATTAGLMAEGIEPARSLQEKAIADGLHIQLGTLPHPQCAGPYDVVTLIDVIEHTVQPTQLLSTAAEVLTPGGYLLLVTPDRASLVARLMGRRWWHYRLAHVGYFDKKNLCLLAARCSLIPKAFFRPAWCLPLGYLWERLALYVPFLRHFPLQSTQRHLWVNFYDSWAMIAQKPTDK